jgi:hypoxanthine phosphoribosyltransferase
VARRSPSLPRGLKPLIASGRIKKRLGELAAEISRAVPAKERPIAVVVLQGAFIFAADLLRALPADYPVDVAFLRCQSYGSGTISSGRVMLLQDLDPEVDLRGRTVLLIDDILDTGLTMKFLVDHLRKRGAKKVRLCVLLRRKLNADAKIRADFCGFAVGPDFVVGYGLDYDGRHRNLANLTVLQPPAPKTLTRGPRTRGAS